MRYLLDCIHKMFKIIYQIIGMAALFGAVIGILFVLMFTLLF